MPFEKIKYCCDHCKDEFEIFEDAQQCEGMGLPNTEEEITLRNHNLGDTVEFGTEDGMGGTRYCYNSDSDELLARYLSNGQDGHYWCLVIRGKHHERIAFMVEENGGHRSLMSPAEYCYNHGFSEEVKSRYPELNES